MTDIEIAQAAKAEPIDAIAGRAGIGGEYLEHTTAATRPKWSSRSCATGPRRRTAS